MTSRNVKLQVSDIVESIQKAETKSEKKELVTANKNNIAFIQVLRLQYDERFKFALPEGEPTLMLDIYNNEVVPFRRLSHPRGRSPLTLNNSYKMLRLFLEHTNLHRARREMKFMKLLGSLEAAEQDILVALKDKKLDLGLNKRDMKSLLPDLFT